MLAEIIIFMFLGIIVGTFTGLIPGIHINLVGVSIVALSASLLSFILPFYLVVFVVAMAITHTFLDFIPGVLLGCPDTDTELSVLPGHEMLKKGYGYEAIALTAYGSIAAIILLLVIAFPSVFFVSKIYSLLQKAIPFILIAVSLFLVGIEKKKFSAAFVFLLTGALGLSVLNLNVKEPLLPLLTGLFGASTLLLSIRTKTKISRQKITKPKINRKFLLPLLGAFIASPVSSLLPGLGSGQAAILGNTISRTDRRGFLVLLGATNTLVMGFSFISLYAASRTRTGAAVAISQLLGNFSDKILVIILVVALISGIASFFLTLFLGKYFSKKISSINYSKLSIATLTILAFIILLVSKPFGLFVFIISTLTGIYCISLGVRRTNMMGCLLIPTIIFYLTL